MSKSKGEFLTVSLLEEKGYDPMVYRLFCLLSHYRKPLEFSLEALDNAAAAYAKLMKRIGNLSESGTVDAEKTAVFEKEFAKTLGNDMNTSSAITVLYDMLKADMDDAAKRYLTARFDEVLSLGLTKAWETEKAETDTELSAYVEGMIAERAAAKKAKDFARADEIREQLKEQGIILKDTREGTLWTKE